MESLIKDLFIPQNPPLGLQEGIILFILFILFAWSIGWKGLALWHCAQNKEKVWFVVILIANTAGILEIAYLFVFSKEKLNIKNLFDKLKILLRGKFQ